MAHFESEAIKNFDGACPRKIARRRGMNAWHNFD